MNKKPDTSGGYIRLVPKQFDMKIYRKVRTYQRDDFLFNQAVAFGAGYKYNWEFVLAAMKFVASPLVDSLVFRENYRKGDIIKAYRTARQAFTPKFLAVYYFLISYRNTKTAETAIHDFMRCGYFTRQDYFK